MRIYQIIALLLVLSLNELSAQDNTNAWLNVGGGNGYSFQFLVNPGRAVIAADYTYWFKEVLSADQAKAFSLMGGYQLTPADKKFFLSFNGGPAIVSANTADNNQMRTSFGVATELYSSWRFSKVFGVGVKTQLNINGTRTFGLIAIGIQVGKLRS